ncbi:MAG: glycosyltransferase family 2 protein [Candidatus Accumulibacter sp.]|jgi:glycosyltransferase involved in cell wall biosynthesis|nr:glycosyltransferase family 2 protein [Accumulibacter sp.]
MKAVAVVPVFNHAVAVEKVLHALRENDLPIILVDDGSDADEARRLDDYAKPPVVLARHEKNRGKGAAVMTGLALADELRATHVLQVDADGQHDARAIPRFLAAAAGSPGALIAGFPRYDASVPRGRLLARYLTHVWVWINTLSLGIRDSMCGFRVYPLAATLPLLPALRHATRMDFDTEVIVRLAWAGVPILNLPVAVSYPSDGISHFRLLRDNLRLSAMHARLFFGMLARSPLLVARHFGRGN